MKKHTSINWSKTAVIVLVALNILLVAARMLQTYTPPLQIPVVTEKYEAPGGRLKATCTLHVQKYSVDGVLVEERIVENDLFLKNFFRILAWILDSNSSPDPESFIDEEGNSRAPGPDYGILLSGCPTQISDLIRIGTDSIPVTISDYKLGSRIATITVTGSNTYYIELENGCRFTISGSYSPSSTVTIRECGLASTVDIQWWGAYPILELRDVFTGITVNPGESLRIVYILQITG